MKQTKKARKSHLLADLFPAPRSGKGRVNEGGWRVDNLPRCEATTKAGKQCKRRSDYVVWGLNRLARCADHAPIGGRS